MNRTIHIKVDGPSDGIACPSDVKISLDNGDTLGFIQSAELKMRVGHFPVLKLESFMSQAEVDILQKNTEILVTINE